MNRFKRWLLAKAIVHFIKETGMGGFLAKLFSTDSIVSRIIRALAIGISAISAMGHFPTTWQEWSALLAAMFAGYVPAGQNNPESRASDKPAPVSAKA